MTANDAQYDSEGQTHEAYRIAVAGKGGTGKTTLSALFVRALKRERESGPILAVDADPNSNLAEALGVDAGRPLADIREEGSSPEGSPASGIGRARAMRRRDSAGPSPRPRASTW